MSKKPLFTPGNYDSTVEVFPRANKNRPREMSSKKPVSRFRDVFQLKKKMGMIQEKMGMIQEKHHRDPRFDDLSGSFDEKLFDEGYSFLNDIKVKEKEDLEKLVEETTDSGQKKEILFLLKRMKNQEVTKKMKAAKALEDAKTKESVINSLKEGKKPFFKKTSEGKSQNLVETFKDLKKSGKLAKYMERKRKKLSSKDRKRFLK